MKLTEFENPLSGAKGNVFDISKLWSMVLGVGVILVVLNIGQRLSNVVSSKLPGNVYSGFEQPLVKQSAASDAPALRVYQ